MQLKDVTELRFKCVYCYHIVIKVFGATIPFEGSFDIMCPECGNLLNDKNHFIPEKYVDEGR